MVSDFTFSPGDLKRSPLMGGMTPSMGGAPVVKRGERLTFLNLDYVRYGGTRHSVASCHGPCNGPDTMTYPNSDGLFYSGPMGYLALAETASSENQATPTTASSTAGCGAPSTWSSRPKLRESAAGAPIVHRRP